MKRVMSWVFLAFIIPIMVGSCLLTSCTTTKEVIKVETKVKYDSVAIAEAARLRRAITRERLAFRKEKETWEKTGVVFENPCPDSTLATAPVSTPANKVEFFDNGKLKTAEGRIKSVSHDLQTKNSELSTAQKTIDSLAIELDRSAAQISKVSEIKAIVKEKKVKVWPFWLFGLLLVGGMLIEKRFKVIARIVTLCNI